MKTVGILTFQQAVNYGAVLQMYALQKIILKLGYDVEIINYNSEKISDGYRPFHYKNIWHPRKLLSELFNYSNRIQRNRNFHIFVQKNMKVSPLIVKNELEKISDYYDYYIVGSDQVWNPDITGADTTYFLDFVDNDKKRLSYAASFGISKWPEKSAISLEKFLNDFRYISVREKTGKQMIQDVLPDGNNITVDVDPVFLLKQDEWQRFCVPLKKSSYVFVYTVGNPKNVYQYASKLANEKKVTIINLRYTKSLKKKNEQIGKVIYDASPEMFVSLIREADYVVTNSFHATAFSVIFNKDVFVEMPVGLSSRIQDLFTTLGIQKRTIGEPIQPLNWAEINLRLVRAREKSICHLLDMLK